MHLESLEILDLYFTSDGNKHNLMSNIPIFSKCTKLKRLDISSGIKLLLSGEDIVVVFAGCGQLEILVLGSG